MRTRLYAMVAALLLVPAAALAQETTGTTPATNNPEFAAVNQIEFGFRGTSYGSDADRARLQRYEDRRDGGFVNGFRFLKDTERYWFTLKADHVGYYDQRYTATYNNFGKVKANFDWNQIPLFYSQDAASLFTSSAPGELRIANTAVRQGIQDGTLLPRDTSAFLNPSFDVRHRRDAMTLDVTASVAKDTDLKLFVNSTRKQGEMPWGASFGFSAANEVALPIDHRTTDFGGKLEYANRKGMIAVGYDGSSFNNSITTLTFDSPFKVTDSTNPSAYVSGSGTSQGRMALWPNSTTNTVSAAAAYNLPAHSRVNGVFSIGQWNQNATLLPSTINTAIPVVPLERNTAEAEARITSFNVNFTSRPARVVWFNVRARRYDFDNRTARFTNEVVRFDQVLEPAVENAPPSYTRDYVDADASFTRIPFTAIKVGYGLTKIDQTFRYFEGMTEHTFRTAVDTTGTQYATFRLAYDHSKRTGSGFDLDALVEAGQQPTVGQFDIANRNRDRVTATAQITPVAQFAIIASAATSRDDYPDNYFGLTKGDTNNYSLGFDVMPIEPIAFNVTYGYEDVKTDQASRNASPGVQFTDPRRDWFENSTEEVHYVSGSVDLVKAIPRTEIRVVYDWNKSNANFVYSLAPDTTLATPRPLPTVYNELRRSRVDFKYFLSRHLAPGIVYVYDQYDVDDFALSPQYAYGNRTLNDGLMLGYFLRPYKAHTAWFRLTYLW